jgi:hypothetical protein
MRSISRVPIRRHPARVKTLVAAQKLTSRLTIANVFLVLDGIG